MRFGDLGERDERHHTGKGARAAIRTDRGSSGVAAGQ